MPDALHLLQVFRQWTIRTSTENDMQSDVATVLDAAKVSFKREFILNSKDRIDFVCGPIGIECKITGTRNAVLRQLSRYACDERISALLLLTSHASHRTLNGIYLQGKPVFVYWINHFM